MYSHLVGVGGIGSGMFFRLRGDKTLGRNESCPATILRRRDFCKLHIIAHYVARFLTAGQGGIGGGGRSPFACFPIGKVGDDPAGRQMIDLMAGAGMDMRFVSVETGQSTLFSVCFLYDNGEGGNITNDDSACSLLTPADVDAAMDALGEPVGAAMLLAAPEVGLDCRLRLLRRARPGDFRVAALTSAEVDEALASGLLALADLVSLNIDEAATVAGLKSRHGVEAIVRSAGKTLYDLNPSIRLCVTAGADGLYCWHKGTIDYVPACQGDVVSTAGAGDAVLAGLMIAQAAGVPFAKSDRPFRNRLADLPLETAGDLASLLAGLAVSCEDTINFDASPAAVRRLARSIGADVSRLAGVLEGGSA